MKTLATNFNVPILFTTFNRFDCTKKVFTKIKEIKPCRLYISSDGYRNESEKVEIKKIRDYIKSQINWDCESFYKFNKKNLGCGLAMSSAIDWFFSKETKGIILEDDCLPNKSFFNFCNEMLEFHKENKEVWHISGCTLYEKKDYKFSYYYSIYPGMWGWATWSDRWKNYELDMLKIGKNIKSYKYYNRNILSVRFFNEIYKKMSNREIDTWDYQWIFTIWKYNGICITPNRNFISNIGFDENATHTIKNYDSRANLKTKEIKVINHPIQKFFYGDDLLKRDYFFKRGVINIIKSKIFKHD